LAWKIVGFSGKLDFFSDGIENFCDRIHDPQTLNQIDAAGYCDELLKDSGTVESGTLHVKQFALNVSEWVGNNKALENHSNTSLWNITNHLI